MENREIDAKTRPVVGRFAPTPSGRLHLGNLMCAMLAWLSVRSRGGKFLLRVEDLDAARCAGMKENTAYLLDDLAFLGIDYDGEVLYQSERSHIYAQYVQLLEEKGLIYPCYCSRAELHATSAPHLSDNTPIYDRRCLLRAQRGEAPPAGRRPALRVMVPDEKIGFFDTVMGIMRNICPAIARISWYAALMASTPTSWPWWWMTAFPASPRCCEATIWCSAHRDRSFCSAPSALIRRITVTSRCSPTHRAAASPRGTATAAW
ncbi:MAG: hypothetical protein J6L87_00730, partial [Clostridia bacterium]|nr:hypothetical protein [Clostridia bacterium]